MNPASESVTNIMLARSSEEWIAGVMVALILALVLAGAHRACRLLMKDKDDTAVFTGLAIVVIFAGMVIAAVSVQLNLKAAAIATAEHEREVTGRPRARIWTGRHGTRTFSCLQVIRQLQTGEPVDFEGEYVTLVQAQIVPAVALPIPIVVGGRSDSAIQRAGRFGDGWFGIWVSAARYQEAVTQMQEAAHDAGRGLLEWKNALNVWCGADESVSRARSYVARAMEAFYGLPYDRFEKWSPAGSPKQLAEFLMPYVAAGCSVFNLIINGPSADAEIEAAAEIRRYLLEAGASR